MRLVNRLLKNKSTHAEPLSLDPLTIQLDSTLADVRRIAQDIRTANAGYASTLQNLKAGPKK